MTPAELSRAVLSTVRRAVAADELRVTVPDRISVQRPPRPGCGDYATNVALQLAGAAGCPPRQVAEILRKRLAATPGIAQVVIAGPGFLNITLEAAACGDVVRRVLERGADYGHGDALAGTYVTPVHDGEPRATVTAQALERLLRACGAQPGSAGGVPERVVVRAAGATEGELRERLGCDAARWAMLRPPADDTPSLDPAVLLAQRASNPLFRVRYAHSRSRALLRNAHDLGIEPSTDASDGTFHHPAETDLLGLIADYPRVVETAARHRAPDRVARHLERLADAFLRFHDECPPLPSGDEKPLAAHRVRLSLAEATGTVLAGGLHLLGISAPEHL
ncbi:DALR anticodon-binding domain-containing protein [Streptomyces sp. H10-C2]|uniref:ArgS-related anticodon-binding protein NrtL n=1 Tax=unclassified Streptomyces TaxID=2593676 RepID=UPI0024B8E6D2|nr:MULTISPECIES: DALR anticodon-binding domain-containing protein [unclassified Streptomyces]MDJ0342557.1 DALR anticodon-binding domain-containing protein [Streptomyces sp. PH10-H1]MDJ0370546.1 DALR anticodon-binding domain-containing protein [Streptomyces sp. H10-C2]